ncbi:MAG: hypothetical protein IPJ75_03235 [Ignavibacteriales bacterium]|nr:hypothetical protein [Ignavibacteriales bacterium]
MDRLKQKLAKLKFRLLMLPADNHSEIPVRVVGFRLAVIYGGATFLFMMLLALVLFRFTPLNLLVNVNTKLSDEDKAMINKLNGKVVVLATELQKIKNDNERLKYILTFQDTTIKLDTLKSKLEEKKKTPVKTPKVKAPVKKNNIQSGVQK